MAENGREKILNIKNHPHGFYFSVTTDKRGMTILPRDIGHYQLDGFVEFSPNGDPKGRSIVSIYGPDGTLLTTQELYDRLRPNATEVQHHESE